MKVAFKKGPVGRTRVPAWPSSAAAFVLVPGLALGLLVGCKGSAGAPVIYDTAGNPANVDATNNNLTGNVVTVFTSFAPAQGEALSTVSLTGAGFISANAVTFNGVYATNWTIEHDTLITAQVPSNATSGPIQVRTTLDYAANAPTQFTVVPQIAAITPQSGPPGTVVTLSGSGFVGTTRVTIGNEVAIGPGSAFSSATNANEITVTVGHDATTGPVLLTASGLQATGPVFTVTAN